MELNLEGKNDTSATVPGAESIMNLFTGPRPLLMNRDAQLSAFGGMMSLDRREKEKK